MIGIEELNKLNTDTLKVLIETGMIKKEDLSLSQIDSVKNEKPISISVSPQKDTVVTKDLPVTDNVPFGDERLLSVGQVTTLLGYKTEQSVYVLRDKGVLPSIVIQGKNFWKIDDVIAYKKTMKKASQYKTLKKKTSKINSHTNDFHADNEIVVDRYPKEYWTSKEVCDYFGIEYDNTTKARSYIKKIRELKSLGLKSYKVKNQNRMVFFIPSEVKAFAVELQKLYVRADKQSSNNSHASNVLVVNNEKTTSLNNYDNWSKELKRKTEKAGIDFGKACSESIRSLNKIYGIDINAEKRNFYKAKGIYPTSALRTVYFVQYEQTHKATEHYEHLFEIELDRYIESHKGTAV